ncbi:MAG: flagellar basal-body rod protein FlgG [Myxococcota bacterium]
MSNAAMFTAVTGTQAQQSRIEIIANNLANLGTVGFKRVRPQFADLFYETISSPSAEGGPPTGLQFGRGVRIVSTDKVYTPGSLRETGQPLDLAIAGDGFFAVQQLNGDIAYTRSGSFRLDVDGNLTSPSGLLLDPPITLPTDTIQITITDDGRVRVLQPGNPTATEVAQIQLTRFQNPGGLEAIGGNLLRETESSGTPTTGNPAEDAFGLVKQGSLEESNVSIAEELVNMIIAQRAFEANTRVISAADDMLRFVTQR